MEIVVRRLPGWSPDLSHSELNELYHHGIKGQRWGVRRYQNPDGSLTPAGMKRYGAVTSKNYSATEYQSNKYKTKEEYSKKSDNATLAIGLPGYAAMGLGAAGITGGLSIPLMAIGATAAVAAPIVGAAIKNIGDKKIKESEKLMSDAQKAISKRFDEYDKKYTEALITGNKDAQEHYKKQGAMLLALSNKIKEGENSGRKYNVQYHEDGNSFRLTSNKYDPKRHNTYITGSDGKIYTKKKATGNK